MVVCWIILGALVNAPYGSFSPSPWGYKAKRRSEARTIEPVCERSSWGPEGGVKGKKEHVHDTSLNPPSRGSFIKSSYWAKRNIFSDSSVALLLLNDDRFYILKYDVILKAEPEESHGKRFFTFVQNDDRPRRDKRQPSIWQTHKIYITNLKNTMLKMPTIIQYTANTFTEYLLKNLIKYFIHK